MRVAANLALTDRERTAGLGGVPRDSVFDNEGMLYVFPTAEDRRFWSRGMRFPIDVLFLDDDHVVRRVTTLQPVPAGAPDGDVPAAVSPQPCRLVLELPGGFCAENGIGPGTTAELPIGLPFARVE